MTSDAERISGRSTSSRDPRHRQDRPRRRLRRVPGRHRRARPQAGSVRVLAVPFHDAPDEAGSSRSSRSMRGFERNRAACGSLGLFTEEYEIAQRHARQPRTRSYTRRCCRLPSGLSRRSEPGTSTPSLHRLLALDTGRHPRVGDTPTVCNSSAVAGQSRRSYPSVRTVA